MKRLVLLAALAAQAASSYAIDIQDVQTQVFNGSCATAGCHNGSTFPNLSSGQSFSAIVNVASAQSSKALVTPGDIQNSYLLDKINGTGIGSRMPLAGPLSASDTALVSDWIAEGALEDDTPTDADGDGIADATDNCPAVSNADQDDFDADGSGDACDSDDDADGVADASDAFPLDATESADSDNDGFGDNFEIENPIQARAYLMTRSTSANVTTLHIINSSDQPQEFKGTLYNADGVRLGVSGTALHTGSIQSQGRVVLTSAQLEDVMGVETWAGPAMLEVGGDASFELMSKLESPSGFISNTNCVRTAAVHNIEGADSPDVTFVRFFNQGTESILDITGSLHDLNGNAIGSENQQLLASLTAKQQVFINRNQLQAIFGEWQGEATLVVSANSSDNLRLLNLNFVNSETFFNFSCYEGGS